ncbi:hypothetical protein [Kribbella sp. NPDC051137]|uniref:hypothetical protein n=1 Tax=Kribbella sp. NPDC051137 TaxID=3155045 RepID=UPI003417794F
MTDFITDGSTPAAIADFMPAARSRSFSATRRSSDSTVSPAPAGCEPCPLSHAAASSSSRSGEASTSITASRTTASASSARMRGQWHLGVSVAGVFRELTHQYSRTPSSWPAPSRSRRNAP